MRALALMILIFVVLHGSGCATGRTKHVDPRESDAQAGPVQLEVGGSTRIRGNWRRD